MTIIKFRLMFFCSNNQIRLHAKTQRWPKNSTVKNRQFPRKIRIQFCFMLKYAKVHTSRKITEFRCQKFSAGKTTDAAIPRQI